MKPNSYFRYQLRETGRTIDKLFREFLSGIPGDEKLIQSGINEFRPPRRIHASNEILKSIDYRRAGSTSKKITPTKEKKKEKSH